ncbi:MAG TPA: hypothetical protein VGX25_34085 [Actinophytocola sp.]|uniref:bestrophin-like domain n=1 Tax=Actinophytocola sp. TaxID=1872138 RepID=UPI002DDCD4DD|nr:hypothetical protein [Actinophytocola sp.]HEV2784445.1 hypothetical protein [Actinophytocola sp.]
MNIYVAGAVWVLGIAALAAGVTILVHRYRSADGDGNDAIATVFGVIGGLHAVLMAFVLISLFDTVTTVNEGSHTEANSLVAVYWASDALAEPARGQIQELARSYARTVTDQEWPSMREGAPVGPQGFALLERMRSTIDGAAADTDWQQERKTEAASQLWNVYQARDARLTAAGNAGVSTVVWLALIVGSALSIGVPYLFRGPKLATHVILMASLAAAIALLMFAIYQLQNPFSGGARVEPDAFTAAIDRFEASRAG